MFALSSTGFVPPVSGHCKWAKPSPTAHVGHIDGCIPLLGDVRTEYLSQPGEEASLCDLVNQGVMRDAHGDKLSSRWGTAAQQEIFVHRFDLTQDNYYSFATNAQYCAHSDQAEAGKLRGHRESTATEGTKSYEEWTHTFEHVQHEPDGYV